MRRGAPPGGVEGTEPMIQDGWVCRACWKPNRPGDDRCYVCKTPRGEQANVEAGSQKHMADATWKLKGRLDTELSIVALIVSWPMWLSGVLGMIAAVLTFILALVAGDRVDQSGTSVRLVLGITAAVIAIFAALWIFVSRSVRRHARWAYVIAILTFGLASLPSLLGFVSVPAQLDVPEWYTTLETILEWVYLVLALLAALLLIASFMRSDQERVPA